MSNKKEDTMVAASKFGDLLNSWTKIFIVYGGAVISCAMAYYKIFENEKDITLEKKDRMEQGVFQEEKSEKRYNESMGQARELKEFLKYQESRILELEKKQAFTEGYQKKENELNNK